MFLRGSVVNVPHFCIDSYTHIVADFLTGRGVKEFHSVACSKRSDSKKRRDSTGRATEKSKETERESYAISPLYYNFHC